MSGVAVSDRDQLVSVFFLLRCEYPMVNRAALLKADLEGTHYVRKAAPANNYWFSLYSEKVRAMSAASHGDFCIVLHGDPDVEHDFYCVPFGRLEPMLNEGTIAGGKHGGNRWVGTIQHDMLKIHPGEERLPVREFRGLLPDERGRPPEPSQPGEEEAETELEDARRNVRVRLKQSRFRARVLANFPGGCCLSGIADDGLLEAAHIVPWAESAATRLDPRNGLCLAVHLHRLFDAGLFSFDDNLRVLVSPRANTLSAPTFALLRELEGRPATVARHWEVSLRAVGQHRAKHGFR